MSNIKGGSKPIEIKTKVKTSSFQAPSPTDTIASGMSSVTPYFSLEVHQNPDSYILPTPPTRFCLALYPFIDPDPAVLNFDQNDVIEIISQHSSGWWDGLVGGIWTGHGFGGNVRRGWVPSNYVRLLRGSEEARVALIRNGRSGVKL